MLAKPAANAIADIGIAVRPRERFSALVGLVVGINQVTFAFGPSLVGVLRDAAGTYTSGHSAPAWRCRPRPRSWSCSGRGRG
jgi:cyanate permease